MGRLWKQSDTHNHLLRTNKRHNGTYTVTPTPKAAAVRPKPKRGSPFGELILGPEAGSTPTAYKPILNLV
ncbi:MAG TPA: hypothetical protein VIM67_06250 [Terriglobus sp.]